MKKRFDEFGNPIDEPKEPEPVAEDAMPEEKLRYIQKMLSMKASRADIEELQQLLLKQQGMIDEMRKEVEQLVESTTASFASLRNMQEAVESTRIESSDTLIDDLNILAGKAGEQQSLIAKALEESKKRDEESIHIEFSQGVPDAYRHSRDTVYMLRRDFMSLLPIVEGTILQVERLINRAKG